MSLYVKQPDGTYHEYYINPNSNNWQLGSTNAQIGENHYYSVVDYAPSGDATEEGNTHSDHISRQNERDYQKETTKEEEDIAIGEEVAEEQWGAPNITKDMFINPDGTPKTVQEVYATLDPILTGITGKELVDHIKDLFPTFAGVPEEEREFAKEAYEADIYKLQPKIGGAVTPTTGVGMRGSIGTKADIKKGFEAAGTAYESDIYGLEKSATRKYETDILGAIGGMPEHTFAKPGTDAEVTSWTDIDWTEAKEGGRVPFKEETFLDFLTQLPDAGGT